MKMSRALLPTVKEMPKDAEMISHKLLIKGGFIKMSAAGVYSYLPMFLRILEKVKNIIREEMNAIGGQELLLPVLSPQEIWEETGRWADFGDEMFRVRDRKNRWFALCPTHEELITDIARKDIRSYKDLPQIWYQIQTKFRDEPRPRSGLLRVRQFEMKDSYSLDIDHEGLEISYAKHRDAYCRIFKRCGIDFSIVQAASGLMGGSRSEEFMAASESGEDSIAVCSGCGKSWNIEVARGVLEYNDQPDELKEVHTPVKGDIETISAFLKIDRSRLMKSILFIRDSKPVFVIIPGDRDIDEAKLALIWGDKFRYAEDEEIMQFTGAPAGYVSPVGLSIEVIADHSMKGRKGLASGANKDQYHLTGIDIERDLNKVSYADIVAVREGDICTECGKPIAISRSIEIGHIFQLGTKYSKSMNAVYQSAEGKDEVIVMGSYGIGLGRIISTAIEQHHDDNGIIWPVNIAPYHASVIPINVKGEDTAGIAEDIYNGLNSLGIETLLDDRNSSPGSKFKDADLLGIPVKIIIGRKYFENGEIEIAFRDSDEKIFVTKDKLGELIKNNIDTRMKALNEQ